MKDTNALGTCYSGEKSKVCKENEWDLNWSET